MKIKSSLNKILLSTLASISIIYAADNETRVGRPGQYEMSLTIPASDLRLAMEHRFPSLLAGSRTISHLPLALMRQVLQTVNSKDIVIQPEAAPIFAWAKAEIQAMVPQFPQLQYLVTELDDSIRAGRFDVAALYTYGFRTLAAISGEPTQDALAVFSGFKGDQIDKDIRRNWQSPFSINDIDNALESVRYIPTTLSERLRTLIDSEVEKISRATVPLYGIFGHGKLGLAPLIESFMNRIYPMPITSQSLTAHGIPMTPLLFGLHDYLHAKGDADLKEEAFDTATYAEFEEVAKDKIDVDGLAAPVARHMVARSNLIEDTMSQLLDLYFTDYLPTHRMSDLKKALVGFFVTLHEDFDIEPRIFKEHNFDTILAIFLSDDYDKDMPDILETDPITGKTSLTAEQVLDAILADGEPAQEERNQVYSEYRFKRSDLEGKKYRIDVTETPMMITVKVKIAGGTEYTWNIETLKYSLASTLDEVGLLKIAGITITPPTQEELSSENGRAIALAYLDEVSDAIRECRSFFKATASELLGHVPAGQTKSLWQKFWDKTKKIDKKFAADVAAIN